MCPSLPNTIGVDLSHGLVTYVCGQAGSGVAELWESTIEAIKSLSVDAAMARALDKRVSALEGVRSSDQDICQVGIERNDVEGWAGSVLTANENSTLGLCSVLMLEKKKKLADWIGLDWS